MAKTTVYGLEITLKCPRCGKECPMDDIFEYKREFLDISQATNDAIRYAYIAHRAGSHCYKTQIGCSWYECC